MQDVAKLRIALARVAPLLLTVLLSAQEDAPAPGDADAPKAPDAIADRLERDLAPIMDACEVARAKVSDALAARIEASQDPAAKARFETDLEAFAVGEVLPASAPDVAKMFEDARTRMVRQQVYAYARAIAAYERAGDDTGAREASDERDRLQERLDQVAWRDLRCYSGFTDSLGRSGFAWEGVTVLSPVDKDASLRVPSLLDTKLFTHYQLRFDLERVAGDGELRILFPLPDCPDPRALGSFVLDGNQGSTSGLEIADGDGAEFATSHRGRVLDQGATVQVVMTCKNDRIRVAVDGSEICDFDAVRRLRLPKALQARFRDATNSVQVLTTAGTQFRIAGVAFREVNQDTPVTVDHHVPRAGMPTDQLPLHAVWRGANGKGGKVTCKVVARNQGLKTATLELRGNNGWLVRLPVETNDNGTDLTMVGARRLDAKVKLFDAHGGGKVAGKTIALKWHWRNAKAGAKGFYEDIFRGER